MIIYPAILSDSVAEITRLTTLYSDLAGRVHIDLIDDDSLEGKTCSLEQLLDASIFSIPTSIQVHLMVSDVPTYLERLVKSNLRHDAVVLIPATYFAESTGVHPFKVGVSISPQDDLRDELLMAHIIQIMTVTPGGQGNDFLPEQLIKIDELRTMGYAGPIQLDGGIDLETITAILARDIVPDALCVGHFLNETPEERFELLEKAALYI